MQSKLLLLGAEVRLLALQYICTVRQLDSEGKDQDERRSIFLNSTHKSKSALLAASLSLSLSVFPSFEAFRSLIPCAVLRQTRRTAVVSNYSKPNLSKWSVSPLFRACDLVARLSHATEQRLTCWDGIDTCCGSP